MTEDLQIRKAYHTDAERIRDIHIRAIRQLCASHYSAEEIEQWIQNCAVEGYRHAIQTSHTEDIYIAEAQGGIIGFSSLALHELRALYIDPDFSSQGYGKVLLQTTEALAYQHNMNRLYLDASLNAVLFYQSQGYEILGPSYVPVSSQLKLPAVRMKKLLGLREDLNTFQFLQRS